MAEKCFYWLQMTEEVFRLDADVFMFFFVSESANQNNDNFICFSADKVRMSVGYVCVPMTYVHAYAC